MRKQNQLLTITSITDNVLDLMDVEWLIHHLCFDETFSKADIDIDFYDGDQWVRLLQSLTRSQLEELEITRSVDYPRRSEEELEDMFVAISNISRLRKLELSKFLASDLSAGEEYFENFRSVQEMEIYMWDDGSPISADVARSIGSIPRLSRISVATRYSFAVSNLFSPHIEYVCVENPLESLAFDHFDLLVEDLTTDRFPRLKSLQLPWCCIEKYQIPLFANMLKGNRTLEELSLSLCISSADGYSDECCKAIIDAMSHNNVLRIFHNEGWRTISQDDSSTTYLLQDQMLQRNTTLEKFNLFQRSGSWSHREEKDVLLRLNKAGRKRLVDAGDGSVKDWIDVMSHEEVIDDLPCLFYLVRMNPSLCLGYKQLPKNDTDDHHKGDNDDEDISRPTKRQCL